MPNTANLTVPYPVLTDTPDVPRDVKAVADRMEAILSQQPMFGVAGGGVTLTTAAQNVVTLSIPAGKWLVIARSYFDYSTASIRTYTARIATASTVDDTQLVKSGTSGQQPVTCIAKYTFAATTGVSMQAFTNAVDGTQLFAAAVIVALPVYYASGW